MNANTRTWWLAPALVLAATLVEAGGGVRLYSAGEVPEAREVAHILSGGVAQMRRPKMRGISLDSAYQTPDKAQALVDEFVAPKSTVVGLPVKFAFNSAEILPENEPQLDAVAEGIKMTNGLSVVVEGHTDAFGPERYNERLSRLRATAVKRYLVQRHGISASRLVVKGLGESSPLDEADPFAAENRRVQFLAAQ
jgi:outer membrane protein OmpA-like peptidoglycan-associated protein